MLRCYPIDDFEVTVFLTEVSSRHAILRKDKKIGVDRNWVGIRSEESTGAGTKDVPVELGDGGSDVLREESQDQEMVNLRDIPMATTNNNGTTTLRQKSKSNEEPLFLSNPSEDAGFESLSDSRSKTINPESTSSISPENEDDKKKLSLSTIYDGFSIYGRILCLVVKRRGGRKGKGLGGASGQAMMEEWIASTQMGEGRMMDE